MHAASQRASSLQIAEITQDTVPVIRLCIDQQSIGLPQGRLCKCPKIILGGVHMTSAVLTELLRALCVLAMLLVAGTFLRAKVRIFQKVFLPASVIGGFIGLLLGPNVWDLFGVAKSPLSFLGVTADWVNIWSLLPGILIVPIFASVPLGMFTNKKVDTSGRSPINKAGFILMSCGLFSALAALQGFLGYGTTAAISAVTDKYDFYRTFGYELSQGFVGGHGTAGAVGRIMEGFGEPYWEVAQGVTTTTATIGLVGGMIIGIIMINIAAKKGRTAIMKNPKDVPVELRQGFTKDVSKQGSIGRETTYGSSIEALTLHLALILVGVGGGYYMRGGMIALGNVIFSDPSANPFSSLPVWFYGMFSMIILDFIMSKLKLNWIVDSKIRAKISGTMSDIAIVAAVASIPIRAVAAYIVPIIIMCIVGFLFTYLFVFKMYGWFYGSNAPFEHAIIAWGTGTGVMINGMMLLKICDPDYETPALVNFSMGFSLMGVIGLVTAIYTMPILQTGNTMDLLLKSSLVLFILHMATSFVGRALAHKKSK